MASGCVVTSGSVVPSPAKGWEPSWGMGLLEQGLSCPAAGLERDA